MQVPFRRISITSSTELDDIAGQMRYSPEKGTYFQYGRLPDAWNKPGVICLDEPNVANDPAVWHFIRPLTDNSKQLIMDMNEAESLDRHPDCYLGLAMNPAWDVRNVGAMEIADADANRLFHTFIDMPPEALEREIISARVALDGWELSHAQLDMIMGIARDIRGLGDELPITWAIRPQIKVARALKWFSPIVAYKRAVGDYLSPDALEILLDQVRAHDVTDPASGWS
jgi:MoxR-like ATPase